MLYITATLYYPGGSTIDSTRAGFDWLHNYWCDLTGQLAKNGEVNPARPVALTAIVVLCSALGVFWQIVPRLFIKNKRFTKIIRYAGILSMAITVFIFTDFHDTVINVAGIFFVVAVLGTFIGLYNNNLLKLFSYGIFCLILILANYGIYETGFLLSILPVAQKVAFIVFIGWIGWVNVYLYRTVKSSR